MVAPTPGNYLTKERDALTSKMALVCVFILMCSSYLLHPSERLIMVFAVSAIPYHPQCQNH